MYPVAFLMGVDTKDCRKVAELIGVKTFLNEFIAYTTLGDLVRNRDRFDEYTLLYNTTDSWTHNGDDIYLRLWNETLAGGILTVSLIVAMRGSRGGQWVWTSNTGPNPLENDKSTKPAFNVGP